MLFFPKVAHTGSSSPGAGGVEGCRHSLLLPPRPSPPMKLARPRAWRGRRWAAALLLLALAPAAAVGGAAGGAVRGEAGPRAAYYILQGKQIDAPDWPAQYGRYALFICNPASVSAAQLERAKRDRPDAAFLAYTCFGWAYIEAPGENVRPPRREERRTDQN